MGIIVILTATVWATIPKLLNFQGVLRDGSGAPISNSTVSVEFKIYDAASNGNAKWMETQSVTTDTFGLFNVVLGSLTPIEDSVFKETDRYLGLKVGADPELLPRVRLVSVAYANRVGTVDGATGGTISGNTVIQSDLTVSGNVGIGMTAPNEQLEITGNLRLPASTASAGVIKSGANRFIHNFGTNNFFAGVNAGNFTTSGIGSNTGVGANALQALTTGLTNTAVGVRALLSNSTGGGNTAVGLNALYINSTGGGNTAIGAGATVSTDGLTNATAIGYNALVDASNKVRIGNTSVTSIGGQVGWSVFSDGRLKTNVKKSPLGLDFILKLNPITYNSLAPGQEGIPYTGLVAQEVEKVLQELGADFSGLDKPKSKDGYYQLRYAEFVMPLIKAIQELNAKNEKLEARLGELEALKDKIKVLEEVREASR